MFQGALVRDISYGLRKLRKAPGFAIVAVLTLAIGIGAPTAIFSIANATLLAPLPYQDANKLVMIWGVHHARGVNEAPVTGGEFSEWKRANSVFQNIAASADATYTLTGFGEPQFLVGYQFSADCFKLLGVQPAMGRTFLPAEENSGGPQVVVLSDSLWKRTFNADKGILGKSINLNGVLYTVVGVMPPAFHYPQTVELWTPLQLDKAALDDFYQPRLRVIGRLKPGVTANAAQDQMSNLESHLSQEHTNTGVGDGILLRTLPEEIGGSFRVPLLVLCGSVILILLIVCANLANLLLVRATSRKKEIAIRLSLGASRGQIARYFLTESLLVTVVGGIIGLIAAASSSDLLLALFPKNIENLNLPHVEHITIDWRVLLFAFLVTLLTGIVLGLVPSLRSSRTNVEEGLRETGRGNTANRTEQQVRSVLVVAEIVIAFVLLAGAGLLLSSFKNLMHVDLGMRTDHVLTAQLFLAPNDFPPSNPGKEIEFVNGVVGHLRTLPGVQSAGAVNFLPLSGFRSAIAFSVEGRPQPAPGQAPNADLHMATPDYFQTLGIRLLKGRVFVDRDKGDAPKVVIVNETLARQLWGQSDPVGTRLNLGDAAQPDLREVVGVVDDVKSAGAGEESRGDLYAPYEQFPFPAIAFVVHTSQDPNGLIPAMKQAIWSENKNQAIYKVMSIGDLAKDSLAIERVSALLVGIFAVIALFLATLGVYGILAYVVAQRQSEIGVRMALGASPLNVLRLVILQGIRLAMIGVVVGLIVSLMTMHLIRSLLHGISAIDPTMLGGTALLLVIAVIVASYIPAQRAANLDPIVALRGE
ncbi:MAG TPA: ABC transporter permease [Candidatus Angelobacter sp.]|jgi:putative ABC transport system permease protein